MSDTVHLRIEGMTCATCARRIEKVVSKIEGVQSVTVDLVRERAHFVAPDVDPARAIRAIESLGYKASVIGSEPTESPPLLDRDLVLTAIAGALAALAMAAAMIPGAPGRPWLEIVLASLCVLGPGASILLKAGREALARTASMDTLVSLGALGAIAISIWSALRHGSHAHTFAESGAVIVALVMLGRAIERRARASAAAAIRALAAMRPLTARVERHGGSAEIPAAELRPGDVCRVAAHERIPADGVVLDEAAWIDEGWLTGESAPVQRAPGDRVLAATLAASTALRMKVTAALENSELAQIERAVEKAQSSRAPIVRIADRVSGVLVPILIVISLATIAVWLALGVLPEEAVRIGITTLVVACPCALGLATPTAITVAIGQAARRGILIRDAGALEALAKVRAIAVDKTGTLTEGRPELFDTHLIDGTSSPIRTDAALSRAAALELESAHPVGRAIVDAVMARKLAVPSATRVEAEVGAGIAGMVEGQAVSVRAVDDLTAARLPQLARERLAHWRSRACTVVMVSLDGRPEALVAVRDAIRPTSKAALAALRRLGLSVHVLTGDHPDSARAIGRELGLPEEAVEAGLSPDVKALRVRQIRNSSDRRGPRSEGKARRRGILPSISRSRNAACAPRDRRGELFLVWRTRVRALKKAHVTVAMLGDGVNDAPALAAADVGIAMGGGAGAAIQSAALTLSHSDPARVAEAVALARQTVGIIGQNLAWAFLYNALMVPLAALGSLEMIGGPMAAAAAMALSSVSVVLNSLRLRGHARPAA